MKPLLIAFYRLASSIITKKQKVVVFFPSGNIFSDNAKYAYDQMAKIPALDCYVFIKKNKTAIGIDYQNNKRFINYYSLKSLKIFLQANVVFVTHGTEFFPYYLNCNHKTIINLWHGTPLKCIGINDRKNKPKASAQKYSYIVCNSDFEKLILSSSFVQPVNTFWNIGSLRHDEILKKNDLASKNNLLRKKVILYAPTFRDTEKTKIFPFSDFDLKSLEQTLIKQDAILILRTHPYDKELGLPFIEKSNFIFSGDSTIFPDIQHLLHHTDLLVTDYSSIYLDYLIMDKPMIMLPYDLHEYTLKRGLLFDFNKYFPGPQIHTFNDFLTYIELSLKDPTVDRDKRKFVSQVFHDNTDGKTINRLIENVTGILNE